MRTTTTTPAPVRRVIEIDEALLRKGLWAAAAVGVAVVVLAASGYLIAAVAVASAVVLVSMSYTENEVRRDMREPMDAVWGAAVRALAAQGLGHDLTRTRRGPTEGLVAGGDARIRVECHPGGVTRVRIRVGWLALPDNRRRAALLLEQVVRSFDETQEVAF